MSRIKTRYYVRLTAIDSPGVLAQISRILGDHFISIASVIQKETDKKSGTAEIVIMTHPAQESALQKALQRTAKLAVVKEIGNFIRVED
jgi:homoserine dehydrogenase